MMPVTEEVGDVAKSAIESMRGSPSCLAAIILAGIMAILTYFALQAEEVRLHERQMMLIQKCIIAPSHETHPGDDR